MSVFGQDQNNQEVPGSDGQSFGSRAMTLAAVLRPWPAELMEAQDVSKWVDSPENDSPELVKPLPSGTCNPGN